MNRSIAMYWQVLAHASTVRLSLRKGKAEQRLMKVIDAPHLRMPFALVNLLLLRLHFIVIARVTSVFMSLLLSSCAQSKNANQW